MSPRISRKAAISGLTLAQALSDLEVLLNQRCMSSRSLSKRPPCRCIFLRHLDAYCCSRETPYPTWKNQQFISILRHARMIAEKHHARLHWDMRIILRPSSLRLEAEERKIHHLFRTKSASKTLSLPPVSFFHL